VQLASAALEGLVSLTPHRRLPRNQLQDFCASACAARLAVVLSRFLQAHRHCSPCRPFMQSLHIFSGRRITPSPCHVLPQAVAVTGCAVLRGPSRCGTAPRLFGPGLGAQQLLPPARPRARGVAPREWRRPTFACRQGLIAPLSWCMRGAHPRSMGHEHLNAHAF